VPPMSGGDRLEVESKPHLPAQWSGISHLLKDYSRCSKGSKGPPIFVADCSALLSTFNFFK
jgi:hypothetical protein